MGELLHPAPLLALLVLVGNDWWAKAASPGWLTGKLSDVAGLVVAPLALTAVVGLGLQLAAALGVALDPSLRRRRLALAVAVVAGGFIATKLSAPAAAVVVAGLRLLGGAPHIVSDPTDLLALPALLVAWWAARSELRLVPRGRGHALLRGTAGPASLAEVRAAGASPLMVARLEAAVRAARAALAGPPGAELAALEARAALETLNEALRAFAVTGPATPDEP